LTGHEKRNAEPDHWSEHGRATSVANADALGRPSRSVLSFGVSMGADAFISFYGIEESVRADSDMSALENRTDDRIVRARRIKLDTRFGRITDGRDYFLLIGRKIADIGVEGLEERVLDDGEFAIIQEEVKRKLKAAGFTSEPRLILRLEAQY
jgi:hypothetical protein